eukprot:66346-Pelagomonas_calceolata.AAC.4
MGMGSTLGQLCCLLVVRGLDQNTFDGHAAPLMCLHETNTADCLSRACREWSLKDVRVTLLDAGGNKVQTNSGSYPAELLNSPQIPEQHVIQ